MVRCIASGAGESVVVTTSYSEFVLPNFQPESPGSGNDGEGRWDVYIEEKCNLFENFLSKCFADCLKNMCHLKAAKS